MKILVLADSHQDTEHITEIAHNESPDAIIHLGDHVSDAIKLQRDYPRPEYLFVAGNCDFSSGHAVEQFITIGGKRIFITHGHRYQVKSGLSLIKDRGVLLGADVSLFGHTHKPVLDFVNGMYLINPGHAGRYTYNSSLPSYCIIQIEKGEIRCDIIER